MCCFRAAGFVTDTNGVLLPTEAVTAWRGAAARHGRGLSWTTDLEVARFFARRYAGTSRTSTVYAAEVPPEGVLGVFPGRKEAELVVDPSLLRNLRIVERVGLPAKTAQRSPGRD